MARRRDMNGRTDIWTDVQTYGRTYRHNDGRIDIWTDAQKDELACRHIYERTDRWTVGQKIGGRADVGADNQLGGQTSRWVGAGTEILTDGMRDRPMCVKPFEPVLHKCFPAYINTFADMVVGGFVTGAKNEGRTGRRAIGRKNL